MNLRSLEHLLAIAETGSFNKAAAKCFITQSALSRSIQNLENELGGLLIDRIGKRNELTPLGLDAVTRAQSIVREAREMRYSAELLHGGGGVIRVGLGSGPSALLMHPLMELATRKPRVQVTISQGPTELQLIQLRSRELDAMVVDARRIQPAADLAIESLGDVKAAFIARSGHPLAARRQVSISDLRPYPIASTPLSDEVARALMEQYGAQAHPDSLTNIKCDDVIAMLAVVARSDAIFLGICAAAREALAAGRLVEIPLHPRMRLGARYAYVTMARRTEAPVMGRFRALVAEFLKD
jgi:DNA-binding transcriptional LysR family regulator